MFHDIRTGHITKQMYLSFTLESAHTISQLKYSSKYEGTTGIFDTLCDNLAFIKIQKFHSLTEASIRFFVGINPKLTLRNVLKKKIDEICTWLDLDDEDTKALTKTNTDENDKLCRKFLSQDTISTTKYSVPELETTELQQMYTKSDPPQNTHQS